MTQQENPSISYKEIKETALISESNLEAIEEMEELQGYFQFSEELKQTGFIQVAF